MLKNPSPFFRFVAMGLLLTAAGLRAEGNLSLKPILELRSLDLIEVESAWRTDCPKRIKVTLRVAADTLGKDVRVKAYFFGADKNRIATFTAPSPIWASTPRGYEAVGLPATLPKNRDVDVFFPITPELDRAWKSVVVVAANNDETVARARPVNALEDLEFPESKTAKLLQN